MPQSSAYRRPLDSSRQQGRPTLNAPDQRAKLLELRGRTAGGRPVDPETATYLASLIDELALLSRERRLDTLAYLLTMAHVEAAKLTVESTALARR
jgi:hypothetical protein